MAEHHDRDAVRIVEDPALTLVRRVLTHMPDASLLLNQVEVAVLSAWLEPWPTKPSKSSTAGIFWVLDAPHPGFSPNDIEFLRQVLGFNRALHASNEVVRSPQAIASAETFMKQGKAIQMRCEIDSKRFATERPDRKLIGRAYFYWSAYPLLLSEIGFQSQSMSKSETYPATAALDDAHDLATHVLMAELERLGMDSSLLYPAARLCRELHHSDFWRVFSNASQHDYWPESLGPVLLELPQDQRVSILSAQALLKRMEVVIDSFSDPPDDAAPNAASSSQSATKPRARSVRQPGTVFSLVRAALLAHHQFTNGQAVVLTPIEFAALTEKNIGARSRISDFFREEFNGYAAYCRLCEFAFDDPKALNRALQHLEKPIPAFKAAILRD